MELHGMVVSVSAKGHAYISASDGAVYLALASNVAEDEVGRRFFILNEECTFEYMQNHRNPQGKPLAVNIKPIGREPVDVTQHHELVTLTEWDGVKGSASRPNTTNDSLWIRSGDIITEGIETLHIGAQLWCKVTKPHKVGQRWRGVAVEVCMESADATA